MKLRVAVVAACLASTSLAKADDARIDKCLANFEEAQLKEKRGKLVEASELYAACSNPSCPALVRSDCEPKRDEVNRRMPTITVVVRDAGGKDLDATIDIDGKPLEGDRTRARPIDPGEHVIGYRVAGTDRAAEKVTIFEGEKARVVTITAKAAAKVDGGSETAETRSSGPSIVGPIIVAGVGVVLLAAAGGLFITAANEESSAEGFRAKAADSATAPSDRATFIAAAGSREDAADDNRTIGIIAAIGGGLALVGGVTWFFVQRPSSKTAKAFTPFAPMVAPGYAGASFAAPF